MALTFDLTAVANQEVTKGDNWGKTQAIIFGCMVTGIGRITEKNYVDWFARYKLWNMLNGFETDVTVQDVAQRIGLQTNVGAIDELENRWLAKQVKPRLLEIKAGAKREMSGDA